MGVLWNDPIRKLNILMTTLNPVVLFVDVLLFFKFKVV